MTSGYRNTGFSIPVTSISAALVGFQWDNYSFMMAGATGDGSWKSLARLLTITNLSRLAYIRR